ncbi:MAG: hypothetical protein Pg6B_02580 [Candidatus Azobacteroides pseudotrichonymphae]|jgi:hypothetical protein|uniref:Uncharacterized protein n=1 Tax=Azobacteroides pseudotrichonymphae genomovar. CFP2 TaxID=511995 RepID=B6YQK2_AZOPC|nr:hypothetical protein [Candidatus Azobacteroides pseudotrichonymphae]BAG83474.1 hypothetical protein CFPG_211 [Candidatus Azobacteroides pseudotrichonymphae genomovar. CFP2]GMO33012.1 MAG: hypothetical protein Pg6B_02580 [Candidatus Azobacteroides pseudotrichonymphae]
MKTQFRSEAEKFDSNYKHMLDMLYAGQCKDTQFMVYKCEINKRGKVLNPTQKPERILTGLDELTDFGEHLAMEILKNEFDGIFDSMLRKARQNLYIKAIEYSAFIADGIKDFSAFITLGFYRFIVTKLDSMLEETSDEIEIIEGEKQKADLRDLRHFYSEQRNVFANKLNILSLAGNY